jgi:hypothetical protein
LAKYAGAAELEASYRDPIRLQRAPLPTRVSPHLRSVSVRMVERSGSWTIEV